MLIAFSGSMFLFLFLFFEVGHRDQSLARCLTLETYFSEPFLTLYCKKVANNIYLIGFYIFYN